MFIGHFALGLAAKPLAPKTSLGTLFMAAQFVDLLWPLLLLTGLESVAVDPRNTVLTPLAFVHYPISHSLLAVVGWATLFALLYWAFRHHTRASVVLWCAVVSHWFLDLIVHRPDLPLYPGSSEHVGLGLWNVPAGAILLEAGLFLMGVLFYLRSTTARDRVGSYGFWGLILFLVLIYISNLIGPPPPGADAVALVGLAQWLLIVWAFWVDRHRTSVPAVETDRAVRG